MLNYKLGKIYKIVSPSHPEIPPYFGSTVQRLSVRMGEHRKNFKQGKSNSSKALMCFSDAIILLVEEFPCENKEQLHAREGQIMLEAIERSNIRIAGRSKAQRLLQMTCECGSIIQIQEKCRHERSKKHINHFNLLL